MGIQIDHVIYGVQYLEAGAKLIESRHGLASKVGGRHPGHGTGNRIIPLGPDYLELMAIIDRTEAFESPLGRWVGEQVQNGDRFLALCLRTDDLDAVARRLDLETLSMSRKTPEGGTLSWRLAGLDRMMSPERLPFFIQWNVPPEQHPGRDEAAHRVRPLGISWVEMGGDAKRLTEWIGTDQLELRYVSGEPGIRAIGIGTEAGEITLR